MSHDFRRQKSVGAIVVRVRTPAVSGLGVLVMDHADQADEFVNDAGAVVLATTGKSLGRAFGAASKDYPQLDALLATAGVRRATRAYSTRSLERMLATPTASWSWERRATVLYRLDTTWALVESMKSSRDLLLLKSDHPLGEIADLTYESFDSDEEYRDRLRGIDMAKARDDYRGICARMRFRLA